MNYLYPVKEEYLEWPPPSSSPPTTGGVDESAMVPPPRPMGGLHEIGPPPFLTKTYDAVEDPTTSHMVSWNRGARRRGIKKKSETWRKKVKLWILKNAEDSVSLLGKSFKQLKKHRMECVS